jgi:hypothetical protein
MAESRDCRGHIPVVCFWFPVLTAFFDWLPPAWRALRPPAAPRLAAEDLTREPDQFLIPQSEHRNTAQRHNILIARKKGCFSSRFFRSLFLKIYNWTVFNEGQRPAFGDDIITLHSPLPLSALLPRFLRKTSLCYCHMEMVHKQL